MVCAKGGVEFEVVKGKCVNPASLRQLQPSSTRSTPGTGRGGVGIGVGVGVEIGLGDKGGGWDYGVRGGGGWSSR